MISSKTYRELVNELGLIAHPEGGYFVETHRSGSTPMSSKGQTDLNVATCLNVSKDNIGISISDLNNKRDLTEALMIAPNTLGCRPDGDIRRNGMTSIIWMPTSDSPVQHLLVNLSETVHFYQGGSPFQMIIYNPVTKQLASEILGPDIRNGHKLQIVVRGGLWKCGILIKDKRFDYCLMGEAVCPGFDFHDFSWVIKSEVLIVKNKEHRELLMTFVHNEANNLRGNEIDAATGEL